MRRMESVRAYRVASLRGASLHVYNSGGAFGDRDSTIERGVLCFCGVGDANAPPSCPPTPNTRARAHHPRRKHNSSQRPSL